MKSAGFSRPFKGLSVCGDSFVIEERNGTFLAAVIDGLGHGFESWVAAEKAAEVIRANLQSCLPGAPDEVAKRIVEKFGRDHDDATALVMGYQADALL